MRISVANIILAISIITMANSCKQHSNPPFLSGLGIDADSLTNKTLPNDKDINLACLGIPLSKEQCKKLSLKYDGMQRLISWKKIGNNQLAFYSSADVLICILYDKYGKFLDTCTGVAEYKYEAQGSNLSVLSFEMFTNEGNYVVPPVVRWKTQYIGQNKFESTQIINDTSIVTRLYEVTDKITMISRASSTNTPTPSMDINTLPVSQTYAACDLLAKYKDTHYAFEDVVGYTAYKARSFRLYLIFKENPQEVLKWICEHKEDKTIQNLLLDNYLITKYATLKNKNNKKPAKPDYLLFHDNILKVKNKSDKEYLLKMLDRFNKDYEKFKPEIVPCGN